ncbi:MAG: L-threonylcarbamoyladenylate synthase [Candidatus Njordarchaeales archaeon]
MTLILKVDPVNPEITKIRTAAEILRKGGLVAFPTETVYGLGADALNPNAVRKIFEAKNRPLDNPIIVHICDKSQLFELVEEVPEWVIKAVEILWPGPVTFVLKKRKIVPNEVTAGLPTVAIRMPAHPVALALIREAGRPIAAPSANLSGKPSPTTGEHVIRDMYGRVDVIIDAGETFFGVESTVIDATEDPPIVLRPGPMTVEELEQIVGKRFRIHPVALGRSKISIPKAPGMKYRHYAPEARLILIEGDHEKVMKTILEIYYRYKSLGKKVALLITRETRNKLGISRDVIEIGSRENLYTVAKNLFKSLRMLDEKSYDIGICEGFELRGVGLAIMNRLRKAASEIINS